MSRMTELAQRRDKVGHFAPKWWVRVGDRDISDRMRSISVTYSSDGTSETTIRSDVSLEEYANAPVEFTYGYANELSKYFVGKLRDPNDGWWGEWGEYTAWGPYKLLSEQRFLVQVDYRNWGIEDALLDIVKRASYRSGLVEIHPGRSFLVKGETGIFPLETFLKDAADTLCESANWVFIDRPGGRRIAMPRPRSGSTGKVKAAYDEGHYPYGGFTARNSTRNLFSRVVIFRRNDQGQLDFPKVDFPVHVEGRYKPSPLNAYVIDNFIGDEQDAVREAQTTAGLLQNGMYECTLTGIDANPDLLLYDALDTITTETKWEGGRTPESYRSRYKWDVNDHTTLTVSRKGTNMELAGTGIRTHRRKLPKTHYPGDHRRQPYVVRTPDSTVVTWDDTRTFEEFGDKTFEEAGL